MRSDAALDVHRRTAWKCLKHHLPPVTLALAFVSCLAMLRPGWSDGIEDRRCLGGELWRLLSGHLAHGSAQHFLLNLGLFVPLAAWREKKRGSCLFVLEYACLAACVAIGVRWCHSEWYSYRGLSGVVYGLIALTLLDGTYGEKATHRRGPSRCSLVLIGILAVKTGLEVWAGGWLFETRTLTASLGVVFLPGSHLGGLVGGAALAVTGNAYCRAYFRRLLDCRAGIALPLKDRPHRR